MQRNTTYMKGARLLANFNRAALAAIAAVSIGLSLPQSGSAGTWAEIGDAGDLPGTAQLTSGSNPLSDITGAIGGSSDADMFRIHIQNPGTFSATTVGTGGTLGDTQLFLFDSAGMGIFANDDAAGFGLRSTLPSGNINGPVAAGDYFIVITGYDHDPINGLGEIFPDTPFSDVHGPTGPGGGAAITGYNGTSNTGTYRIVLTGAEFAQAVPEPASLMLLGLGMAGMVARRFKKQG